MNTEKYLAMVRPIEALVKRVALQGTLLTLTLVVAACGGKKPDAATQAAARVNDTEVTVHQINYRLQQERGLKPEQMDEASRKVLERLIDQELVLQKAEQLKLDRDPRIIQALDAARHDVLAKAYVEQVVQGVPNPTDDAIHKYFDDNPDLFAHRRIFALLEIVAKVPADKLDALKAKVAEGKSAGDITNWLTAEKIEHKEQAATRAAEQVPLAILKTLSKLPDGRGLLGMDGPIAHISVVTASHEEPVTFERAKPAISQYLANDARRKAVEGNVQALRSAAKVEYLGKYAGTAASQPARVTTLDADLKVQLPTASTEHVALPASAASGVTVTLPNSGSEGVKVSLPNAASGSQVQVSLPNAASGVQVSLPGAAGNKVDAEAVKKGLGGK
jgi:EpsD family peptidyl-prolyl cis-trans isomerase